ncbi:CAF17-like 4Fe-4S cluster assembly/insertion protein YgfZ [Coxiella endosymbiont of Amblyomma nuttalli]|uniref:CAF17-like 4Fe-4S cluster assembly/insertion protein YgfZ n=1 Tax=Coxiella endosymbiont of Amblyomma nuttalli TaxID=2749996 RepID=UPI001BAA4CD4|nr:folate-binding protein YgfZ [Coxiella endosymbiont of Amblyomma nuttalli]QTS83995.1 tRNA-modifying protein YgfZ [Coxiella endosymbiont of Amblyomma nuttalli]
MLSILIPVRYFALISIAGKNASTFLQGQLTCDMRMINETYGSFGACCNHKGRMMANFFIFQKKENYYFLLPKSVVQLIIAHLKKYAVFLKVELTTIDNAKAVEYQGSEIILKDIDENTWRLTNIKAGLVWIYPATSHILIPQMINLQKWGGVSFNKGCYTGQEIIARSEYLGTLKRHLYRANVIGDNKPTLGEKLKSKSGQPVGIVVEAAQKRHSEYELLAVLQSHTLEREIILNQLQLKNLEKVPYPIV